ncbi:MAG: SGNH/GDSL hydrolase family protein [Janthinobacterium lividum]
MSYVLVFDGDSIAFGQGATHGYTLADQTSTLLSVKVIHHVTASGGRRISECRDLFETNVKPLYQKKAARNVIFFCAGDNDIAWDSSPQEAYSALETYVKCAQHEGWYVVVSTKLQRYDWPEAGRAAMTELNNLILNNRAGAEGVADFQNDSIMGSEFGRLDQKYYTADHVHPANAGYTILARIAAAALLPILLSADDINNSEARFI